MKLVSKKKLMFGIVLLAIVTIIIVVYVRTSKQNIIEPSKNQAVSATDSEYDFSVFDKDVNSRNKLGLIKVKHTDFYRGNLRQFNLNNEKVNLIEQDDQVNEFFGYSLDNKYAAYNLVKKSPGSTVWTLKIKNLKTNTNVKIDPKINYSYAGWLKNNQLSVCEFVPPGNSYLMLYKIVNERLVKVKDTGHFCMILTLGDMNKVVHSNFDYLVGITAPDDSQPYLYDIKNNKTTYFKDLISDSNLRPSRFIKWEGDDIYYTKEERKGGANKIFVSFHSYNVLTKKVASYGNFQMVTEATNTTEVEIINIIKNGNKIFFVQNDIDWNTPWAYYTFWQYNLGDRKLKKIIDYKESPIIYNDNVLVTNGFGPSPDNSYLAFEMRVGGVHVINLKNKKISKICTSKSICVGQFWQND